MKKLSFALLFLAAAVAAVQACGSRYLTANLDTSSSQVVSQLNNLQTQATNCGSGTADASSIGSAIQLAMGTGSGSGASLYYAQAPGSMGDVQTVAPLNLQYFTSNGSAEMAQAIYAYFIYSPGQGGYLIITGTDGSGVGAQSCGTTTTTVPGTTASPTPLPSSTGGGAPAYVDFAFVLQGSQPGTVNDGGFTMNVTNASGANFTLQSYDLDSGGDDLAGVIQLQIYTTDPSSGGQAYVGNITLAQPN